MGSALCAKEVASFAIRFHRTSAGFVHRSLFLVIPQEEGLGDLDCFAWPTLLSVRLPEWICPCSGRG